MGQRTTRKVVIGIAVVAVQAVAAAYFMVDAIDEHRGGGVGSTLSLSVFDLLVGFALLAGIAYVAASVRQLQREAERREQALAVAQGAMTALIEERFAKWNLSRAEAEVALFALKGFTIAQIAELRGAASGTVRSQLSQVYAKAGVNGQPMLMSLFLDDLIEVRLLDG